MGKKSPVVEGGKEVGKVLAKGAAVVVVPVVVEAAKKIINLLVSVEAEKVTIPSLYDKDFTLDIEQATEILNSLGLKAVPVKLRLSEADPKYRNCEDNQVVGSHPKHKRNFKKGEVVCVKYITTEVIAESKRIFEERERERVEEKERKIIADMERNEKRKQEIAIAAKNVKHKIQKVFGRNDKNEEKG